MEFWSIAEKRQEKKIVKFKSCPDRARFLFEKNRVTNQKNELHFKKISITFIEKIIHKCTLNEM